MSPRFAPCIIPGLLGLLLGVGGLTLADDDWGEADWVRPAGDLYPSAVPGAAIGPFHDAIYDDGASESEMVFRLTQAELEAEQPFDIIPPDTFPSPFEPPRTLGDRTPATGDASFYLAYLAQTQASPSDAIVGGNENMVIAASDAGALLVESNSVQTVEAQRRSPVAFDPHIRGYTAGQVYTVADGGYWVPARRDLDSMLAKIDTTLIRDVVVIPGPYGLRYGPGFSFLDVQTYDAPRYVNGYEGHVRVGMNYRTNSNGINGVSTLYGGNANYGYVFSYNNRTGDDYYIGGNGPISRVPSSYHNQNFWGQFGYDVSPNTSVEVRYQRLDQVDTEYAAQIFDIRYLTTDGFGVAINHRSPYWDRVFRTEVWYNRTRFEGDSQRSNKRSAEFPVINRINAALETATGFAGNMLGFTDGDLRSTGARFGTTWGAEGNPQLRLGTDVRFVEQHLHERYDISSFGEPDINTNLPRAQLIDPGIYSELILPSTPYWRTSFGGRIDWAHTTADDEDQRPGSSLPGFPANRDQNDLLYAFYVTSDVEMTYNTTVKMGVGHAQRVPTLTERYADGIFLGIIQNGFSRVIGNPALQKERAWQADLTVVQEYDSFRSRVSGFCSWIDNYITYEANAIADPTGARLLQAINTTYATLAGIEWHGEVDLTTTATGFATFRYLDGRDQGIEQPLAQIAPLESRVGIRLQDPSEAPRWGGEFGVRMVDRQHREALFRPVAPAVGLIPVEQETPGFTTAYIRGFYNVNDQINLVGGVENLFDRTYIEHLDLRLPNQGTFTNTIAFSPGITPYMGIEWER